jgi:gamma-glutamyltranspeptidase/glutathione hydrolase
VTASINNYYGAKVAHPGLGFLYNDYMNEFEIGQPEHPSGMRPRAMPYSSMSPTILTKDGEARLVLGSPGSARIISAITQVVQLWVNGVPLKDAVAHPRLHVSPSGQLLVENPEHYESATEKLIANGFDLREPADDLSHGRWNPYFGGVHALALESGNWVGAADPRRDGTAVAVKRSKEENATVERR